MTLYRITLQVCTPLITPLKGDTIWGHIAWGIANHEGDEGISAFLAQMKSGAPPLIVSSAFPTGMLCRPLPEPQKRPGDLTAETYANIKADKTIPYVSAGEFLSGSAKQTEETELYKTVAVTHNLIDRETNVVREGGLYAAQEQWMNLPEWDVYVLSSFEPEKIVTCFERGFENGYGADASTGKGKILVKKDSIRTVAPQKKGTRYMALAPFVGDPNQPVANLRGTIFIRTGRLGSAFASTLSPYKKTVILFDEGSVFTSEKPIQYTGRILEHIHQDPRIHQAAVAPVLPIA